MRQPGQKIRGYTLKKSLGAGGMGEVWLAATLGPNGFTKNLCIKTMLPSAAGYLDYFATEARIGGRLTHSNLVNVIDFFSDGDEHFIVMEYVEGLNLRELLARVHTLPVDIACYVAWCALKGLHFAHTAALGGPGRSGGLVHRDVTPDNILISGDAEVKVSDFGIAHIDVEWRKKTEATNAFRGKPIYVSPEYLMARVLDARADVYQVGVMLYEMLAGAPPFGGTTSMYVVTRRIVEGEFPSLREVRPDLAPEPVAIVHKMMHADVERRYASAEAARVALARACPELLLADRTLANLVLHLTAPKRRPTSPFLRPEDLPQAQASGGVVVDVLPDDADTVRVSFADAARAMGMAALSTLKLDRPLAAPVVEFEATTPRPVVEQLPYSSVPPARSRLIGIATGIAIGLAGALLAGGGVWYANSETRRAPTLAPTGGPHATEAVPVAELLPATPPAPERVPTPTPAPATMAAAPATARGAILAPGPRHLRRAPRAVETATSGRVVVYAEERQIKVFVDDVYVGLAPLSYEVDPGLHQVTLLRGAGVGLAEERDHRQVRVAAGAESRLNGPRGGRP